MNYSTHYPQWAHCAATISILIACSCSGDGPAGSDAPNHSPTAEIVADPYTLRTGESDTTIVTLTANVRDEDGDPLTLFWNILPGGRFVDGTTAYGQTTRVAFTGAVPRTITLEVDDGQGGTASTALTLELGTGLTRFTKSYIEALFLGSGPFAPRDGNIACPSWNERWSGFPKGTTVRVIVSTTVNGNSLDGGNTPEMIRTALTDVPYATAGWLDTTFEMTDDPDPMPELDEVTSTDHPDPVSTGCSGVIGCIHHGWRDPGTFTILATGRAVQQESLQAADGFVHDVVGHGVMGLCHIDQASIGGNAVSLMPGGPGAFNGAQADRLTTTDIAATRAVFGSGLSPGAGIAEFLAKDLINR